MLSSFRNSQYRSIEVVTGPNLVLALAAIVAAALAQAAFGHFLAIRGAVPSVVAMIVILYAIRADLRSAIVVGAVAGLIEDGLGGTGGAWLTATTLVAAGSNGISRIAFADGIVQRAAYVWIAVVVRDVLFWAVERMQNYPSAGMFVPHLKTAALQGALTAVIAGLYLFYRLHYVREQTMVQRR